ncbi:MAG TPA: VWA domain-containing protein [Vicinamibacterales bacterium]|jgi:Ca-activated chloride channel family protein|nr:VWA domain-containing protein [Vicinamibacterales bacterium]
MRLRPHAAVLLALACTAVVAAAPQSLQQPPPVFKTGVELINVTATVSDANGRFVPGLRKEDFLVYEDDQLQEITSFSADRVPVSLGMAIDTSGSMTGDKIHEAERALNRFLYELLDAQDEIFLYRFSNEPQLLQGWTSDRTLLARALERLAPNGGTALYDAVVDAVPLLANGRNAKKALLVISDGRDTSSRSTIAEVHEAIRQSEALLYAVGIDCAAPARRSTGARIEQQPPIPLPFPPRRRPFPRPPAAPPLPGQPLPGQPDVWPRCTDPVDVAALRDITDDSGGRTEVVHDARDLNPATANIADELSKQYYLAYPSSGKKDGRFHSIRVEVKGHAYRVRARRGYVAS